MAIFPFTENVDDLIDGMDLIPIDDSVPFAESFKKLLAESGGNPWGPQTTPRSKLATRLHFAGWTSQQLEAVGLKPRDVENFRRNRGLKTSRRGRPVASQPTSALSAPALLAAALARREELIADIAASQDELARIEETIKLLGR